MSDVEISSATANTNNAKSYIYQYLAGLSATSCMFAAGVAGGWNAPTIPKLLADDSPIPISRDEASWLITMAVYGTLITTYPAIWLDGKIGPKRTLLLSFVPFVVGWLLVEFATDIGMLYASRICFGLAYGFTYTMCPVYLSEIASDRVRGSLLAFTRLMLKSGMLFCIALASFVEIRTMALIALVPIVVFAGSFVWMPDSPNYLMSSGDRQRAQRSVRRLRGGKRSDAARIEAELLEIEQKIQRDAEERLANKEGQWRRFCALFGADHRRGLTIALFSVMILPLCGTTAIMDYSQLIFRRIDWPLSPVYSSIMLSCMQLTSALIGIAVVDRVGRRPLLIGSSAMLSLCNVSVAVYFGLEERSGWSGLGTTLGWLPAVGLMLFQFAYGIGLGPIGFSIVGELFPKRLKALASGICFLATSGVDVIVGKMFQVVTDGLGSDVAFVAFAIFTAAYCVFVIFFVPETKNRSLEDILEELKGDKKIKK